MIVMTIFGVLSAVLIGFYSQAQLILSRGITQTTLQQRARLAAIRIVPKIASSVFKPERHSETGIEPAIPAITIPSEVTPDGAKLTDPYTGSDPAISAENTDLPSDLPKSQAYLRRTITLNSTIPFVEDQLRFKDADKTAFNPRTPIYRTYRLW